LPRMSDTPRFNSQSGPQAKGRADSQPNPCGTSLQPII
jgi:hypothetical protein